MGPNITAEPADDALKMALARRNLSEGCVHRSDHGSQYVSLLLSKAMRDRGIRPLMWSISCRGTTPPWSRPWASWSRSARTRAPTPRARRPPWTCSSTSRSSATGQGSTRRWATSARRSSRRPIGLRKIAAQRRHKRCQWNRGRFTVYLAGWLAMARPFVGCLAFCRGNGLLSNACPKRRYRSSWRNREIQAERHGAVDALNELLMQFTS